ncbi:ABC transporter substrate-binding protein [Halotalea alkalilenta]|uniref:ABC transporter substrate-binding protein n=1 Tax=Halotalea alkalilenta TaxID=376489 RepID=UPI000485A0A6|nr:ABC transporter substrate-binding protein [Halotalea alkalilenta]
MSDARLRIINRLFALMSSQPPHVADFTRRQFIGAAAKLGLTTAAATQMTSMFALPALAQEVTLPEITTVPDALKGSGEVRYCSYGGALQEAQRRAYLQPFTELTGIRVIESEGPDSAKIRAMVDTGNYEYDLCEFEGASVLNLQTKGDYFEEFDYSLFDTANIPEHYLKKHYFLMLPYAQIIAFRPDAFDTPPASAEDLWDTENFPGPRSLQSGGGGLSPDLEIALMAAGVPPSEVYPIDMDKAFASLEKIKPEVVRWWEAGAIPAQLLSDDEVVMATAWNGRIDAAQRAGAPIEIIWRNQLLRNDCWAILKNAPNRENALKLSAFMSMAAPQARLSSLISYGFINDGAEALLPAERLKMLPTSSEYIDELIPYDDVWWSQSYDELSSRWARFILS